MLNYIDTLPVSEKKKSYSLLKTLWEIECKCSSLNTDRCIDVMFITGGPGTGKTYYAKKFLNKLKYDFYVSSSSNDPLQDYLGQKLERLKIALPISYEYIIETIFNNKTQVEIAKEKNISKHTVSRAIKRGYEWLRADDEIEKKEDQNLRKYYDNKK